MKNLQIKIVLVCLFSLVIVSTVNCNIFNQGENENSPDKSTISKGMVYVAINVGRVIANTVFTMEDDLVLNNPIKRIKGSRSRSLKYDDNERMAIAFGIVALIFLIINMYYGGKIVEFLKSKGRKAHYYALRWMIFSYVNQYKQITTEEEGRVGPYYRPISVSAILFIIAIAVAVYFAVLS